LFAPTAGDPACLVEQSSHYGRFREIEKIYGSYKRVAAGKTESSKRKPRGAQGEGTEDISETETIPELMAATARVVLSFRRT
jgi:hypothetical protein